MTNNGPLADLIEGEYIDHIIFTKKRFQEKIHHKYRTEGLVNCKTFVHCKKTKRVIMKTWTLNGLWSSSKKLLLFLYVGFQKNDTSGKQYPYQHKRKSIILSLRKKLIELK